MKTILDRNNAEGVG